ncbi:MAG: hypothetical protein RLP09_38345 [Sandaracinaceae bacterium]
MTGTYASSRDQRAADGSSTSRVAYLLDAEWVDGSSLSVDGGLGAA